MIALGQKWNCRFEEDACLDATHIIKMPVARNKTPVAPVGGIRYRFRYRAGFYFRMW